MVNSRNIDDLRPDVANACKKVISLSKDLGIDIIIISTVRDDEYQAKLYAQGRDEPGQIVTNARYTTFHGAGLAFDFCPIDKEGNCMWNRGDLFVKVGEIGKLLGLEWGGDWKTIVDMPHLQWSGYDRALTGRDIRDGKRPEKLIIKEEPTHKGKEAAGEETPMTLEEAKRIVQEKTGFTEETMAFLNSYIFRDSLFLKLAKAMREK
jgi:peptidoglycan L-alanyl-D-glutamate endopeptidase CwlK